MQSYRKYFWDCRIVNSCVKLYYMITEVGSRQRKKKGADENLLPG